MQLNRVDGYPKTDTGIFGNVSGPLGKSRKTYRISQPIMPKNAYTGVTRSRFDGVSSDQTTSDQPSGYGENFHMQPSGKKPGRKKGPCSGPMTAKCMLLQLLLAGLLVGMGLVLLLCTVFVVYLPVQSENAALEKVDSQQRIELQLLINEVLPSMKVEDDLSELILRSLDSQRVKFQKEGAQVANEIEQLREADPFISDLMEHINYQDKDFHDIVTNVKETEACMQAVQAETDKVDTQINELGVATLKQNIAELKGTTTTVTREDENGETITETVVQGGLISEAQSQKDALQKQYDEMNGKLEELEGYLADVDYKITGMYNRLNLEEKAGNVFAKMEAITEYVKKNPKENMFLTDTEEKLASFPGESREEDDILFIMKIEAETGIHMPNVNYGQDYQLTKLSNGMMLCYEVYSIPYYASYQGLKNLISYFNENDDFYASVYTLSIQYNPQNKSIQGNIIIMHYYLLQEGAEYVPPVIDEEITPGTDGIFGDNTDNGKPNGPMSSYTPEDIEKWLDEDGLTLEEVRKKLTSQGYPETELLWILKKKYKTEDEIRGFMEKYGDPEVDYSNQMQLIGYLQKIFPNTDLATLIDIYNAKLPEDEKPGDDTPGGDTPGGDTPGGEEKPFGKQSDYTYEDLIGWLDSGKSLEEVREDLISEGYPATDLAWIIKEGCSTTKEMHQFLRDYGDPNINYADRNYLLEFFDCDKETLMKIYQFSGNDDDDKPGTDTPGTDTPGTDTPGTDTPGTDTPGTDTPGTDTPGTDTPGTDTPGTDTPGTDTPGTDTPGTDTPGTDTPGTDPPGTDTPGTDTPGTDTPGTDTPGTDTPGTDTPGTDTPGTDTPGTDTPGTDTPGTDTPGTDTPGTDNPGGNDKPGEEENPYYLKQSNYTFEDLEEWIDSGKTMREFRDQKLKAKGYPATDMVWILREGCETPDDLQFFLLFYGDEDMSTTNRAFWLEFFECDEDTLRKIYEASGEDAEGWFE